MWGHDPVPCRDLRQDRLLCEDGHVAIAAQRSCVGGEEESILVAARNGFLGVGFWGRDCGCAGDEDDESVNRCVRISFLCNLLVTCVMEQ